MMNEAEYEEPIRKILGVRGRTPSAGYRFLKVHEIDDGVSFVAHSDDIRMSPKATRAIADQLYELASRVEARMK